MQIDDLQNSFFWSSKSLVPNGRKRGNDISLKQKDFHRFNLATLVVIRKRYPLVNEALLVR